MTLEEYMLWKPKKETDLPGTTQTEILDKGHGDSGDRNSIICCAMSNQAGRVMVEAGTPAGCSGATRSRGTYDQSWLEGQTSTGINKYDTPKRLDQSVTSSQLAGGASTDVMPQISRWTTATSSSPALDFA